MTQSHNAADSAWLDLSEAAEVLGVHFTTLRRWVDAGQVPCIRTPGGRRRFRKPELDAFLRSLHHGAALTLPDEKGIRAAAVKVGHLGVSDEPWYRKLGAEDRNAMRSGGQQLMAILMQYATRSAGGEPFLLQGRRLAAFYGDACREAGLSLIETMEAFLYVRHSIFDSVYEAGALAGLPDADTWRLYDRMNQFLDSVLLATVEAFSAVEPAQLSDTGE